MAVAGLCFWGAAAWADGAPAFTVSAASVTMPSRALGSSAYTVSGIPEPGTLVVTCGYPLAGGAGAANLKIPTCSYGPILAIPVTPGQTVTGMISFYPYGSAVPLSLQGRGSGPAGGLAVAGALLAGLGLRRLKRRWAALSLLALGGLAALAATSGCVAPPFDQMTPGTYPYVIKAVVSPTNTLNPTVVASTTIQVTVP